ncbi:MAG: PQQ-binding-like beta-propeller repeat protein [Planctomycetes bacterium]|nr:PQQ-binding-like beta-propeller repeat protein [Planctomycetota bacterium]
MPCAPFLLLGLAPFVLAGDPSQAAREDWPSFRGDPALTGVAAGILPVAPAQRWSFQAPKSIVSSPVVAEGRLVVGCDDGKVYCLDAASGEERWTFATDDVIEAPALIHAGSVYVGSSSGWFYALELARGALRWKQETGDKILGGANWVVAGGETRIVVGSYDSSLHCFAALDGSPRWTYSTGNYVNGTPAVENGWIVFGGCDSFLHVVSAEDGAGVAKIELGSDAHVAGSVALAQGRVYFGHYGNAFVCADLPRKELVWSFPDAKHPFFSSPALAEGRAVFGGRNKQLHCVAQADGKLLWKFATRRKVDGSPVIVGDAVVFGAGDGRIHVLALSDGSERWSVELGSELGGSLAVAGGWIYAAALDGRVTAFGPPVAEPVAEEKRE